MTLLASPARRVALGSALAVAAVTALVPLTQADAADPAPTWSAATLVGGSTTIADTYLSTSPTGRTYLMSDNGGGMREVTATGVGPAGTPAIQIAWLPNGDSIVESYSGSTLTYRFANGTLGSKINVYSGIATFAANAGELLIAAGGSSQGLSAVSYAIGTGGTLTPNGDPVPIETGPYFETGIALDADGTAEVVTGLYLNSYDTIAVASISGTVAAGVRTWHTPVVIDPSINNGLQVAADGGRIVAAWPDNVGSSNSEPHLYAAVRTTGASTGARQTLLTRTEPAGGYLGFRGIKAAAGPDGTLSVAAVPLDCADGQIATVASAEAYVWASAPTAGTALSGGMIAGTTWTTNHTSTITSLAAGGGQGLAGVHDTDVTSDTSGVNNASTCGAQPGAGKQIWRYTDRAVLTGGATHSLGNGAASQGPDGDGYSHDVAISAASMASNGYATVFGSLDTPSAVQYATYGAPGTPTSPASPTPAASVSTAAPASPSPSAPAPPKQKGAPVTTVTVPDVFDGNQIVYETNTTSGQENLAIAEQAYATGLTTQAPHLFGKAPKLVKIASAKVTLKAHKKTKITLHLSSAAKKALKAKGKLKVILTITTKAKGYATKVTTKTITLKQGKKK